MNKSKCIRSCKRLAWIAMLSGAIVTTLSLSAFGQQEVDPTWYDPWAAPNTTAIYPVPQASVTQHHAKVKSVSASKRAVKASAKRSAQRPRPS